MSATYSKQIKTRDYCLVHLFPKKALQNLQLEPTKHEMEYFSLRFGTELKCFCSEQAVILFIDNWISLNFLSHQRRKMVGSHQRSGENHREKKINVEKRFFI